MQVSAQENSWHFRDNASKGERNALRHLSMSDSMGHAQCSMFQVVALWSILLANSQGVYLQFERPVGI